MLGAVGEARNRHARRIKRAGGMALFAWYERK